MAKKLKETLKKDVNTTMEFKYLVTIPATEDHRNHVVGAVSEVDIVHLLVIIFSFLSTYYYWRTNFVHAVNVACNAQVTMTA